MIISIILAITLTLSICWGAWSLLQRSVRNQEWKREEQEKQLRWKKIEQQYQLEEEKRLREKQLEDRRAAEVKRQEDLRAAEQKRQDESCAAEAEKVPELKDEILERLLEKHTIHTETTALIREYVVEVSESRASKVPASCVNDLTFSTVTKKTNMDKLGNFVSLDTETTGLKYMSDEIIDIAAIRFRDFQPVEKFSMLLAPGKPIPQEASAVNHITDDMVAGCPCFQQVAVSLVEFIGDDNIVGHNLPFDLKFIVHYGADVTVKKRKYYDTLTIAQKTVKKIKQKWDKELEDYIEDYDSDGVTDYKLGTLCSYFGIANMNAHRAESDALAAGELFHKLAEIRKG